MEQIITEKPIIITPEKTKKQTTTTAAKRGVMTHLEDIKREKIHQLKMGREEREQCDKLEKLEKRVKLSEEDVIAKKSPKEGIINSTFGHNGIHESVFELNGCSGFGNNESSSSLSLLSSSASLTEGTSCLKSCLNALSQQLSQSPMRALSQISTSYSNLDDESLNEESSLLLHKKSSQEECVSTHFLSQKVLSDDEIEEEDEDFSSKSSSDNPIPNLTSQSSLTIDSCPLRGQSLLKSTEVSSDLSQQTIASLQVEDKSSSTNAKKVTIANSASYLNREHTKKWSNDETLKFYKGLELFGTDFSMIARLFTNRTRKMCKNKFRKEEKMNIAEIETRLLRNRQLRMKKVVQKLNAIRARLNLKNAKTPEERIQIIQNARRARLDSFNSIDSLDITVVETIESQLNGQALF